MNTTSLCDIQGHEGFIIWVTFVQISKHAHTKNYGIRNLEGKGSFLFFFFKLFWPMF